MAAWFALNGCGEMTGTTWIEESGFLEGPILLTNTASVGTVRDAVIKYSLAQQPQPVDPNEFGLYLPVVAETYDGRLNDILGFHVTEEMVYAAIDGAKSHSAQDVQEGNVGGGTGMTCFNWKGGIGTSSRTNLKIFAGGQNPLGKPAGYTVGVLVQANHGKYSDLVIRGVPVGKEMTPPRTARSGPSQPGRWGRQTRRTRKSSIIVVIATDAPLLPHHLKRLARRAALGIGRTGTIANHDSGDIFIAFSTANTDAWTDADGNEQIAQLSTIPNGSMDPLFEATVAATEEAIINALVAAETMVGRKGHKVWGITDPELQSLPNPGPSLMEILPSYRFQVSS